MADVQKSISLATGVFLKNKLEKISKQLYLNQEAVKVGKAFADQLSEYYYEHFGESTGIKRDTVNSAEAYYIIREAAYKRNTRLTLLEQNKVKNKDDATSMALEELDKINTDTTKMRSDKLDNKIASMVSKSVEDFIKDRNERNEKIKSAYAKVVDHTGGSLDPKDLEAADGVDGSELAAEDELDVDSGSEDMGDDEFEESARIAKYTELTAKQQPITLFEAIVESLTKSTVDVKGIHNNKIDMEQIIESAQAVYGVLEIANAYKLMTINEELLDNIINA